MSTKPTYAASTTVSESTSRGEIERELTRFGATEFGYVTAKDHAAVAFVVDGRRYVLRVPMPTESAKGAKQSDGYARMMSVEQRRRQRWRALALGIKAILVMVTEGVLALDEVLMPYLLLPSGETVGDRLLPDLREIAATGTLPPLMVGATPPSTRIIALGDGERP